MKKSYKITLLFLLFAYGSMSGQNSGVYSLEQCLAKGKCTYIMDVHNSNTRVNDLKNRLFRIRTLPKIRLYATLPNLVNTISPVTLYDGSEKFINRFYMSSSLSIRVFTIRYCNNLSLISLSNFCFASCSIRISFLFLVINSGI